MRGRTLDRFIAFYDRGGWPRAAIDIRQRKTRGVRVVEVVSARLDKSWIVVASYQIPGSDRCVDVFARPDGTFGFEEFRQDVEDMRRWTPIAFFSAHEYGSEGEAVQAAREAVAWLGRFLDR